jgi:cysteinyl-tRNA synthetase
MKLYNSLTKQIEDFIPSKDTISMYSCGPTVYNNLHIGNLSAFVYADLLRRVLTASFPEHKVRHVMNITDVDDKTIRDSKDIDNDPMQALLSFTRKYEQVFMDDMSKIGNDLSSMEFIRATDSIEEMLDLIRELYNNKIAYIADDGVYFSIEEYKKRGKTYGQLVHIDESSTSSSRIQNDEYDKESAHDFALWKQAKDGEPSWAFELDGHKLDGRPGWHIECSAMSRRLLGQPFDIHTGGIDLKFPHHENEIAQSTACTENPVMASVFVHNEHVLVEGTKMSKSLGNFYTLRDLDEKGYDPMAFRMLVLQGHYRNSVNFSWDNLEAAQNNLDKWRKIAALRWQTEGTETFSEIDSVVKKFSDALEDDLSTPKALFYIEAAMGLLIKNHTKVTIDQFERVFKLVDESLGFDILRDTPNNKEVRILAERYAEAYAKAKTTGNFMASDTLREQIENKGYIVSIDKDGRVTLFANMSATLSGKSKVDSKLET